MKKRVRFFLVVPGERTRSKEHKLKHSKFQLKIMRVIIMSIHNLNLMRCESDLTLEAVALRGCVVSTLGDIQVPTGPCFEQGVELLNPERSFPTSTIL